jgi:alkanesulfonate monooxygenase SsuD/methylene tetrahydromethanopterin reductase-like flavin-dependent oxidoreductase (luciferase family)
MAQFDVGVQLHPQTGVDELRATWRAADALGVDSIWVWDHFFPLYGDPDGPHFEAYSLLAAMAADTQHARIGALDHGPFQPAGSPSSGEVADPRRRRR